jgi:hypothetical protein
MHYYPRLEKREAVGLLGQFTGLEPARLAVRGGVKSDKQFWYPTAPAGQKIQPDGLRAIQARVRELAAMFGCPDFSTGRGAQLTAFDRALTAEILSLIDMIPSEASVEAVWSFLSLVLLPDVAFWRFPNRGGKDDFERILGRPRNVFRRLWWRAYILGGGEDGLASKVLEDEAVGILERTRLGGNRRFARIVAETHVSTFADSARRTDILRDAMKRLSRLHAFVGLHALTDDELTDIVVDVFAEAGERVLTMRI